ncbi:MAG: hypothetical protein WC415_02075 [Patescibacteria group bacterium]|jgi:hypothetical protein
MLKKNKISNCYGGSPLIIVIIIIASLIVGFALGVVLISTLKNKAVCSLSCASSEKFMAEAKNKLIASGLLGKEEIKFLSGEAIKISGQEIIFTAPLPNPLLSDGLKVRTAVITDETEIVLKKEKNREELKKDNQEGSILLEPLEKRAADLKKNISLCSPEEIKESICFEAKAELERLTVEIPKIYKEKMGQTIIFTGKIADLKGKIKITAWADEDISEKSKFNAIKIELTEMAEEANSAEVAPTVVE